MSHIYCPECGFQNPEAANFCSRCGAALVRDEPGSETTMSYTPEEGEEEGALTLEELGAEGPALVIRSGTRTRDSRRATCALCVARRGCLAGEDRCELVDVDLVEHALPPGLTQPRLQLGAEQVDLAVQDPPPVRDLQLLLGQVVDQLLEVVVRERAEIGKRFHC